MTDKQWVQIGRRIRMLRKRREITLEEMVLKLDISQSHFQQIEAGKKGLTLELLAAMAEVLNVSLDYLILGISPIPKAGDGIVRLECGKAAEELEDQPSEEDDNTEEVQEKSENEAEPQGDAEPENEEKTDDQKKTEKKKVLNWKLIGNRIREMRVQRGLTVTELAAVVHISSSHLSNIEHGKKTGGVDIIVSLALALGVSVDYIVRGIRPVIGAGNWGLRLHSGDQAKELPEQESDASEMVDQEE